MAESANILDRTEVFIKEYKRLLSDGQLPDNKALAIELGMNSASTISNILARRQNIKADSWAKFRSKYMAYLDREESEQLRNGEENDSAEAADKEKDADLTLKKLADALANQAAASKIQAEANKENAEAINKLASAIEKIGSNFGTILSTQDAGFGLVAALLNRQVHKDANGNEEKAKADLDEIVQRIGTGLGPIAKKGIHADAGK